MRDKMVNCLVMVERAMVATSAAVVVVLAVWVSLEVMLRYAFNMPIVGTYELIEEYAMPMIVFLSLSGAMARGKHVAIDLVYSALPDRAKSPIDHAVRLISLAFFAVACYMALVQAHYAFTTNSLSRSSLGYPMWPAYLVPAVGFLVLCGRLAIGIGGESRGR
jgi:TRAP-type C4-dicarboxylate transport system permease small subunit